MDNKSAVKYKRSKKKLENIEDNAWEESKIKGYKIAETSSEYGGLEQRWLVIESETRKQATIKKIDKQVEKQLENALASLCKLSKQEFACIADAEIAIKMLSDSWKYHQIKEIKCQEKASQKPTDKTQRNKETKKQRQ